jgi:hypothetical protein
MKRILGFLMLTATLFPTSVLAADASARAILDAMSEGTAKGICTPASEQSGSDCQKTTMTCSGTEWSAFVNANYTNRGGSVTLAGGSSGAASRPITDVTTDISNQSSQILSQHKTAFASCPIPCPPDISKCGIGTEYPFISNGKRYIGRIMEHTNLGCRSPGVTVFEDTSAPTSQATGQSVAYLAADWERNKNVPPGPVQRGSCYCRCGASDPLSACQGKDPGYPVLSGEDRTYEECTADCGTREVAQDKCRVTPIVPGGGSLAAAAAVANTQAMCFTPSSCAEAKGIFEAGTGGCGAGQGRCYAQEPEVQLNTPIGSVTKVQGMGQYVATGYRWIIGIVAIASTIMFVYGAFKFLIGTAIPTIANGKQIMIDAVIGMILVLSATAVLRTINPATTRLDPIKTYMVNTRVFLNTAFCKDLPPASKLAEAGKKPNLKPYESISESAFTIAPAVTKCGESYWMKDSVGAACVGQVCPTGKGCVSCADGDADGCNGKKSTERVCQTTVFNGTITYADQRVPEEMTLIFLCNSGQPVTPATADPDAVISNWTLTDASVGGMGLDTGTRTTDEEEAGQAVYRIPLSTSVLNNAKTFCADKGGLRGAVLGVQYNDDSVDPTLRLLASAGLTAFGGVGVVAGVALAATTPADDFAVVSQQNCGNANGSFDGYGNGRKSSFDTTDLARAMLCGFSRGRLLDGPGVYWKEADLKSALDGSSPIVCDFALNHDTAPSDPGRVCPAGLQ